jgi:ketosteroid isomerase-like protein
MKRDLIERYIRAYNGKDIDAMMALFDDLVRFESVSNGTGVVRTDSREELRALALQSAGLFTERRQTATGWVENGDDVAVEIDFQCRLAEDFPDMEKAGKEMTLRGASFFTIRNGRITRLVDYM